MDEFGSAKICGIDRCKGYGMKLLFDSSFNYGEALAKPFLSSSGWSCFTHFWCFSIPRWSPLEIENLSEETLLWLVQISATWVKWILSACLHLQKLGNLFPNWSWNIRTLTSKAASNRLKKMMRRKKHLLWWKCTDYLSSLPLERSEKNSNLITQVVLVKSLTDVWEKTGRLFQAMR